MRTKHLQASYDPQDMTLEMLSELLADYGVSEASRAQIVEGMADFEALVNPFAGGVRYAFATTSGGDQGRILVIIVYSRISDYRYPVPLVADVLVKFALDRPLRAAFAEVVRRQFIEGGDFEGLVN